MGTLTLTHSTTRTRHRTFAWILFCFAQGVQSGTSASKDTAADVPCHDTNCPALDSASMLQSNVKVQGLAVDGRASSKATSVAMEASSGHAAKLDEDGSQVEFDRTHAHVPSIWMLQNKREEPAAQSLLQDVAKKDAMRQSVSLKFEETFVSVFARDPRDGYKLGALFLVVVGLAMLAPALPSWCLAYIVCAIYVTLSVSIDLLIASQRQQDHGKTFGSYAFDPACCVILVEGIKLVFSFSLVAMNYFFGIVDLSDFRIKEFLCRDAGWLALPGILFALNNMLLFVAISKNDMTAFGVFRETLILWTSMFWRCFFDVELGYQRIIGICVIFVGLVGNRLWATEWTWAVLWILAMTFANASATVVNEFALKRTMGLDINVQNATLYIVCMTCSILVLAVRNPSKLLSSSSFFEGFEAGTVLMVILQVLAGLTVSRILKYADSVMKCVAATLRGPILVLLAPYLVHSTIGVGTIVSSLVVSTGCLVYLLQGPLQMTKVTTFQCPENPQSADVSK